MRLAIVCLFLVLSSCGAATEEEAKTELDQNTITLDPPPGTYTFQPWVIMTKKDDGIGSGILYVKPPGAADFDSATLGCVLSPYDSESNAIKQGYCVEVKQSGDMYYYLENSAGKSEEQKVNYQVEFLQTNILVESRDSIGGVKEAETLEEIETTCRYLSDKKNLEVIVKTKNAEKLTSNRYAYVAFELVEPKETEPIQITKENSNEVGILFKQTSDSVPSIAYTLDYSTNPYTASANSATYPVTSCDIEVTKLERGRINSGTIDCKNLRLDDYEDPSQELLGKFVDFSGNWKCDKYE